MVSNERGSGARTSLRRRGGAWCVVAGSGGASLSRCVVSWRGGRRRCVSWRGGRRRTADYRPRAPSPSVHQDQWWAAGRLWRQWRAAGRWWCWAAVLGGGASCACPPRSHERGMALSRKRCTSSSASAVRTNCTAAPVRGCVRAKMRASVRSGQLATNTRTDIVAAKRSAGGVKRNKATLRHETTTVGRIFSAKLPSTASRQPAGPAAAAATAVALQRP